MNKELIILNYQLEDFINILLNNDYIIEIKKYDIDRASIVIVGKKEMEEK